MVVAELTLVGAVRVHEELNRARSVVLVALLEEKSGKRLLGDGQRPVIPRPVDALLDSQDAFQPVARDTLVKLACELPEDEARSLSIWTCADLARTKSSRRFIDRHYLAIAITHVDSC
jgi:hypothetical protein